MSTPLFAPLFQYIEANLHKKISIEDAARTIFLSPVHATRLFSFAYGITPAEYIRKRKLSESLCFLQKTDKTVLEIALHFGFSHEQSFTRAFFAEFGLTPGKYRNTRPELPVLLPIPDFGIPCGSDKNRLFGPEMVLLPEVRLLGIWHKIPYRNSTKLAPQAALDFWERRKEFPGGESATVFYGLTHHLNQNENDKEIVDYSHYLTAIENTSRQNFFPPPSTSASIVTDIPAIASFGGVPCIKFHYIGKHHYRELSQQTARQMYRIIRKNIYSSTTSSTIDGSIHLEKIDTNEYNGEYCLMEWYAPIL